MLPQRVQQSNVLNLVENQPENYKQEVFWRNHVPIQSNRSVDLWLEYEKDPQVSIQLQVKQFAKGEEGELQQQWILEEGQMQDILCLENTLSSGVLFFSLMASGNGKLRIRQLHCRNSRQGFGHFLPGGERFATVRREEIFCYFDPGDLKPPLNVFFSDRKKEEGFEEHRLMRKLGCPFLLITETRLGSGAGYLGSEEYEALIMDLKKEGKLNDKDYQKLIDDVNSFKRVFEKIHS